MPISPVRGADGGDPHRFERGRDASTVRPAATQDRDVARLDATRLVRQHVPHQRLRVVEQLAHGGRERCGILGLHRPIQAPALDHRAERVRTLRDLGRGIEPHPLSGDAVDVERRRKHVGGEAHQLGTASPRIRERLSRLLADTLDDRRDGRVHEPRVGAAEAVDGLFLVAHPDAARGHAREREEDVELQRAGVLELIHQHEVHLLAQHLLDSGPMQQLQGQDLLVDEVHQAPFALVFRVGLDRLGGELEHRPDAAAQFLAQRGVTLVAARRLANRLVDRS